MKSKKEKNFLLRFWRIEAMQHRTGEERVAGLVQRRHVPDQVHANGVAEVEIADPEVRVEIGADVDEGLDHHEIGRRANVTKRRNARKNGRGKRKGCLRLKRIVSVVSRTFFILSFYGPG